MRSAERWRLRLEVDEPGSVVAVATEAGRPGSAAGTAGAVVGFASAGATRDEDSLTDWELYSINVLGDHHGTGVADELLVSVIGGRPATLWVLAGNQRAQAFYARHGFVADGTSKVHEGTGAPEIRMVRRGAAAPAVRGLGEVAPLD